MRKLASILVIVLGVSVSSCHKEDHTKLIYQSDFNTYDGKWYHACDAYTCFTWDNGKYDIVVTQPEYTGWAFAPGVLINSGYSITADCSIHLDDVTKWGATGFIFNWVDNYNYDYFMISTYGHYGVFKISNKVATVLQAWSSSSAIKVGNDAVNSITLNQSSSSTEVIANGTSLATITNSVPSNFKVGFKASSSADFTKVVASFDNLTISRL